MTTLLQQMEYLLRYWDTLSVPERDDSDAVHTNSERQRDHSPPAVIKERIQVSPSGTPTTPRSDGRGVTNADKRVAADVRQPSFSPDATLTEADNTMRTGGVGQPDPNNLTWQLQSVLGLAARSPRSPALASDGDNDDFNPRHHGTIGGRNEDGHGNKGTASLLQQAARNAVADVQRDEARRAEGISTGTASGTATHEAETSAAVGNGQLIVSFKAGGTSGDEGHFEDSRGRSRPNGVEHEKGGGRSSSGAKRHGRRDKSYGRCWYCRHSQRYDRLMFASDEEFEAQLRSDVARIEMSRAMLRLYVSSAGAFQGPLEQVFSFLFNYIDHHIDWCVDYARNRSVLNMGGTRGGGGDGRKMPNDGGGSRPDGSEYAEDELDGAPGGNGPSADQTAAFESVRRAEKRANEVMAAAADQKKRHTQDIVAARKRIDQLEKLLAHQMALTHRINEGDSTSIKQLVARAEKEKLIDEIEKQLADAMTSNDALSEQVQSLRELNAAYARQSVELVARLHAVQEHNTRFASHGHVAIHEMIRLQKEIESVQARLATVQNEYHIYTESSSRGKRGDHIHSEDHEDSISGSWHGFENDVKGTNERLSLSLGSSPFAAGASLPLVKQIDSSEPPIPNHYDAAGDTQWVPEHMRCAHSVKRIDLPYEVTRRIVYDLMTQRIRERASAAAAAAAASASTAGEGGSVVGAPVSLPAPPPLDAFFKTQLLARYGSEEVALQYSYALLTSSERYSADVTLWAFNMVSRQLLSELVFDVISTDITVFLELCAHVATRQQSFRARESGVGFDLSAQTVDFRITEKRRSEAVVEVLCTTTVHMVQILSAMYPGYSTAQLRRLIKAAKRSRVGGENVTGGSNSLYYMMLFPEMQSNAMLLADRAASSSSSSSEACGKTLPNHVAHAPRETPFSSLFKHFIVQDALRSACYVNERLARFEKRWRTVNCQQLVTLGLQYLDTEDAKVWVSAFRDPLRDIFFSLTGEGDGGGNRRSAVGNVGRDSLQSSLSMVRLAPEGGDVDDNVSLSSVSVKDVAERVRACVVVRQSVLPLSSKREDAIRATLQEKQKSVGQKTQSAPEWIIARSSSPTPSPSKLSQSRRPPKATIIEPNSLECHGVANSALVASAYHMVVAEKTIALWEQTTFDEQLVSVNAKEILQEVDPKRALPWTIRTANTIHRPLTTHTT